MTLMLSIIASIPTLIFMVAAPELFALLFGEQWRQAGVLLVILAPALALKFVVSTLSGVFSSTGNSHLDGYWKILAFFSTFIMLFAMSGKLEVKELLIAMVVNDCFLYFIYYRLILQAIRKPKGFI
jgi:O-antigen/teichoic acid export membrane protein